MTVTEEISEMLKTLDGQGETEVKKDETPKTEERTETKVEGENKEDVKDEKSETTPIPETKDEKGETGGEKKEEVPPVVTPEPDEKDRKITELMATIEEMKASASKPSDKPVVPDKKEPVPEIKDQDFVGDIDLDDLTRDPKELNKLLNKVYQQASKDTEERLSKTLPEKVKTETHALETMQKAVNDFYESNKDLKAFPKVVSQVFGEIVEANPNKTYGEIIALTEADVRKRLGLAKPTTTPATKKEEKKEDPPPLPRKGGRAGSTPETQAKSSIQAELDEMDKALNS